MFHMQRQRKLPEEHARFYSAEITLALHFLHDRGKFCLSVIFILTMDLTYPASLIRFAPSVNQSQIFNFCQKLKETRSITTLKNWFQQVNRLKQTT